MYDSNSWELREVIFQLNDGDTSFQETVLKSRPIELLIISKTLYLTFVLLLNAQH